MSKDTINDIKDKVSSIKRPSLNEIIHNYTIIAHKLEEGEATDELLEELEVTENDFAAKLYGMYYMIQLNEAKKNDFYKLEIEKYQGKIKRLDKNTDYLTERCMLAIEVFGTNNKIVTEALNASKVTLKTVNINQEEFETRINLIKDYITGFNLDDDFKVTSDEQEFLKCNVVIKNMSIDNAKQLFDLYQDIVAKDESFNVDISLKSKEAKEKLIEYDGINQVAKIANPELFTTNPIEELKLELVGVTLDETSYPRFS